MWRVAALVEQRSKGRHESSDVRRGFCFVFEKVGSFEARVIIDENKQLCCVGLGASRTSFEVSMGKRTGSVGSNGRKGAKAIGARVEPVVHARSSPVRRHDVDVVLSLGSVNSQTT
eukprot:1968222-Pleurochrysis_carterae.AAC.2